MECLLGAAEGSWERIGPFALPPPRPELPGWSTPTSQTAGVPVAGCLWDSGPCVLHNSYFLVIIQGTSISVWELYYSLLLKHDCEEPSVSSRSALELCPYKTRTCVQVLASVWGTWALALLCRLGPHVRNWPFPTNPCKKSRPRWVLAILTGQVHGRSSLSYPTPKAALESRAWEGKDCSVGPPSRLLLTPFLQRSLMNSVGVTREMTYLS